MGVVGHSHLQPISQNDVGVHSPDIEMVNHGPLQTKRSFLEAKQLVFNLLTDLSTVKSIAK